MPKRLLLLVLIAVIGVCASAPNAFADFRIRVENVTSGVGVVVTDNASTPVGFGDDNATAGILRVDDKFAPFTIRNLNIGMSKPFLPTAPGILSQLDLHAEVIATGAGVLRITIEDTGYTAGANSQLSLEGSIGGTLLGAGNSITMAQTWAHPSNSVIDLGPDKHVPGALGAIGGVPGGSVAAFSPAFTAGTGAFSGSSSATFSAGSAYSLFTQVIVTFVGSGGTLSLDFHSYVTPEPASIMLALSGLPVLAIGYMRRKRRANAVCQAAA